MGKSIFLNATFDTPEELDSAILEYSDECKVPYVTLSSVSIERYNRDQTKVTLDPKLRWKEVTVTCKHYGKPRQHKHKEGTKRRPNQSTFKKFCGAKFSVNYHVPSRKFVVTRLCEEHSNHPMPEELQDHYPEFRQPSAEAKKAAEGMLETDTEARHIRAKVCSFGKKATRQDIQNLRNQWRASLQGEAETPEEATFIQLENMLEEDKGSNVVIHCNPETKEISSIFFQTSWMREAFEKYPEVLEMDTTHKLCENDMPLTVYQVVDCFGAGRIAGYSILANETSDVVTESLKVLVEGCPDSSKNTAVVLIDKCPSEIKAATTILPDAEIHLCDWHVKENFDKEGLSKMGASYRTEVQEILETMRYSHTRKHYDDAYKKLERNANDPFMEYFNERWHESVLIWKDFQRNQSFNLKERTTGRTESHNAGLKKIVKQRLPVNEVVFRLRVANNFKELDNQHKLFLAAAKTKYHKYSQDPIIQKIMELNVEFVAKQILIQYERSQLPPSENQHEVTESTCDCKFFKNTRLPYCAHIFRLRRKEEMEIYDHSLIPERWTVSIKASDLGPVTSTGILVMESQKTKSAKVVRPKTAEERYNQCMSLCQDISSLMSQVGGIEFELHVSALESLRNLMQKRKKIAIVTLNDNHDPQDIAFPGRAEETQEEEEPDGNMPKVSSGTSGAITCISTREKRSQPLTPHLRATLRLPLKVKARGRPRKNKANRKRYASKKARSGDRAATTSADEDDPNEIEISEGDDGTSSETETAQNQLVHDSLSDTDSVMSPRPPTQLSSHSKQGQEGIECDMCERFGKPDAATASHFCFNCKTPVHSFGCSVVRSGPDVEEGSGGTDLVCVPCSKKLFPTDVEPLPSTSADSDINQDAGALLKSPPSSPNRSPTQQSNAPLRTCFKCNRTVSMRKCGTGTNSGRNYYACMPCQKFICWEGSSEARLHGRNSGKNNRRFGNKSMAAVASTDVPVFSKTLTYNRSLAYKKQHTSGLPTSDLLDDGNTDLLLRAVHNVEDAANLRDTTPTVTYNSPILGNNARKPMKRPLISVLKKTAPPAACTERHSQPTGSSKGISSNVSPEDSFIEEASDEERPRTTQQTPKCVCGDVCAIRQTTDGRVYFTCWKMQCQFVEWISEKLGYSFLMIWPPIPCIKSSFEDCLYMITVS